MRQFAAWLLVASLCGEALAQVNAPETRLRQKILEAQASAEKFQQEGRALGARFIGTLYNEVDLMEHRCTALGILLGKESYIGDIKPMVSDLPKPDGPEDAAFGETLLVYSHSYSIFAGVAQRSLDESEHERAMIWNLDCVGKFGIDSTVTIPVANARATFRVEGKTLFVLGDIEPGFSEEFSQQIANHSSIEIVALGSAGGSVSEAIRAGYMIRALRLNTRLFRSCYSACSLLFLGGVERQIWSPYPELGFHQASRDGVSVSPGNDVYRLIDGYVTEMGVNSRFVLAAMFSAKPDAMYSSKIDALCQSRAATWVQRLC